MQLGLFFMPVHRPEKPWAQALAEDRQAIIEADGQGYAEVWVGEHFTSSVERIPAPLMFFATLVNETRRIRFGTGVVNLGHRHPLVVAAEAAQFDHLSGGRLMLGVGPGGLASDAELFGGRDMPERVQVAMEAIDLIQQAWATDAPFSMDGRFFDATLRDQIWLDHGVGVMCHPLQQPHPPLAMAMVSPGGPTAETIAERGFIPISANFVPIGNLKAQWESYAARRDALDLPVDRSVWRVCRNILITDSAAEAEALLADEDGDLAFYFRYLKGLRMMREIAERKDATTVELNALLGVSDAIDQCVIAGTADEVTDCLVAMADHIGGFGTLVAVGHDRDTDGRWQRSQRYLAEQVGPRVAQHVDTLVGRA